MKILKFKSNINCGDCVKEVSQYLDNEESISKWQVDTDTPEKLLSVSGEDVDPQRIENLVKKAGFKAEMVRVIGAGGSEL